jgi:hypothetical protein
LSLLDLILCLAALLLAISPAIFRKYRYFRDKLVDWIERKQFERLVDQVEADGR